MNAKADYIDMMKQQLNQFDAAIEEYEDRTRQACGDAKVIYKDSLFNLRQQWDLMHDKLEIESNSSEKNGFDGDACELFTFEADQLRHVFVESFTTFKSDYRHQPGKLRFDR